ncbi:hypothetical protein TZ02_05025 [Clostridium aceticum]|nr:hypothetical protein TZ02_05025 [Clostridium aceticum]
MERIFSIGIAPLFFPAFWLGRYFAILFPADQAKMPVTLLSDPNLMSCLASNILLKDTLY